MTMDIFVNGEPYQMNPGKDRLDYDNICRMAGREPGFNPTVTYAAPDNCRRGELRRGEILIVEHNMVINCHRTTNA